MGKIRDWRGTVREREDLKLATEIRSYAKPEIEIEGKILLKIFAIKTKQEEGGEE